MASSELMTGVAWFSLFNGILNFYELFNAETRFIRARLITTFSVHLTQTSTAPEQMRSPNLAQQDIGQLVEWISDFFSTVPRTLILPRNNIDKSTMVSSNPSLMGRKGWIQASAGTDEHFTLLQ